MREIIKHSFEAGRRGKPDEFDSSLANLIGIYFLKQNNKARFDIRVSGTFKNNIPFVKISGEVSESLLQNKNLENELKKIILNRYNYIYKTKLKAKDLLTDICFKPQSDKLANNKKAGDSGNPIAIAYKNSINYLPIERYLTVGIRDLIDEIYLNERPKLKGLGADGKICVEANYLNNKLISIDKIVIAVEHKPELKLAMLRNKLSKIVLDYLHKNKIKTNKTRILINQAGSWNLGGWVVDEGSREAKPYRDSFGSYGVQEDSFSGEDCSKPSATGTFLARYIAVQIVANNLADFARVSLSYTIGSKDVGLNIFTNNTGKLNQNILESKIKKLIPLSISDAIKRFNLYNPKVYGQIVKDSDYFQNSKLPWNKVKRFRI